MISASFILSSITKSSGKWDKLALFKGHNGCSVGCFFTVTDLPAPVCTTYDPSGFVAICDAATHDSTSSFNHIHEPLSIFNSSAVFKASGFSHATLPVPVW